MSPRTDRHVIDVLKNDFQAEPVRPLQDSESRFVAIARKHFFTVGFTKSGRPFAIGARYNVETLNADLAEYNLRAAERLWIFDNETSIYQMRTA
jgi:hypothetical protein